MVTVLRKGQRLVIVGVICVIALLTTCQNSVGLGGTIDINPPTIDAKMMYPPVGAVIRDNFILSVEAKDDTKIDAVTVSITPDTDAANPGQKLPTEQGFFNLKKAADGVHWQAELNKKDAETGYPIKDGAYQAVFLAKDGSGKEARAVTTFVIDNTPPLLILNRPSTAIAQDASLAESTPDVFGADFLLVGQVYDNTPVAALKITAEGNGAKQEKTLYNIPQNIRLTVDSFPSTSEGAFYTPLYGSDDPEGSKSYTYSVAVTDSAKEYKNVGDSGSGTGNTTGHYYLFDDLYKEVLSKYKIQKVYAMLHGIYTSEGGGGALL